MIETHTASHYQQKLNLHFNPSVKLSYKQVMCYSLPGKQFYKEQANRYPATVEGSFQTAMSAEHSTLYLSERKQL